MALRRREELSICEERVALSCEVREKQVDPTALFKCVSKGEADIMVGYAPDLPSVGTLLAELSLTGTGGLIGFSPSLLCWELTRLSEEVLSGLVLLTEYVSRVVTLLRSVLFSLTVAPDCFLEFAVVAVARSGPVEGRRGLEVVLLLARFSAVDVGLDEACGVDIVAMLPIHGLQSSVALERCWCGFFPVCRDVVPVA